MEDKILYLTLIQNGVLRYSGLENVGMLCLHLCLCHKYSTVRAVKIWCALLYWGLMYSPGHLGELQKGLWQIDWRVV